MIERVHTSVRLKEAMDDKGMRQVDLLEAVRPYCEKFGIKFTKGQLSQYISGRNEPGQRRIYVLALALDVSEPWLMGLNVPKERKTPAATADERTNEFVSLFSGLSSEQQALIIQAMKGILASK